MTVAFSPLHPHIGAEVSAIDLRDVSDRQTLEALRSGMDQYGVLVFRNQPFTDTEQLAFAQRFDGTVQAVIGSQAIGRTRLGTAEVADISNIGHDGKLLPADDRRRIYALANRLWHTDSSFREPAGRYSMLSARVIPAVRADTEFADMRAAHEALDAATRTQIESLSAHHSIAYSRQVLGFEFSRRNWICSKARCSRWSVPTRARSDARFTLPRMQRASSAGRCPRAACCWVT